MTKTPQELAAYLRKANAWRRSDTDEPMPDPTELGEAIDQVISILEKQAQSQSIALSDCCEAPAVIKGKPGSTQWYACPDCYDPCDVFIRTTTTTQPQPTPRNQSPCRRMNWQPIETAPKDGTEILAAVRYPKDKNITGVWTTAFIYWDAEFQEYPDGVWAFDYEKPITSGTPTHWIEKPHYVEPETEL